MGQPPQGLLEKYFPAKKANSLKKAISNIEQEVDETLYEYFERFTRLRSSCPFHGYSTQDLVLYFYNGLLDNERRIVDAACGGNILNSTPELALDKIQELAEGTRNFGRTSTKRGVHAVHSGQPEISTEIAELKEMVKRLTLMGTPQQLKACGVCADPFHPTDLCPQVQDESAEVNAMGYGQKQQQRQRNDPYAQNYMSGWRDQQN